MEIRHLLANLLIAIPCFLVTTVAHAMVGEQPFVSFTRVDRGAALVSGGVAAPLWVDEKDYPAVVRAARDVQADVERVTGIRPELAGQGAPRAATVVIAGTLGRSRAIDQLIASKKLDAKAIAGKWE